MFIFKGLILLFIFLIIMGLVFLSAVSGMLNALFGTKKNRTSGTQHPRSDTSSPRKEPAKSKKKIFDKDDGEYVDYEEVKDER